MAAVSMKALLESGVHFGHRTNKWEPRMKPYIFTERNGIHIIDLQQTVKLLGVAHDVVRDAVAGGGTVLFVGTKRQAQETIRDEAMRCGMPYVTERWLGGMLTNWSTMYARIQELERLEQLRDTGEIARLTKKEGLMIQREIDRLLIRLSGVREMKRLPELLFVVDVGREDAAVHEANLLNIPVVALVDTNCNPQDIDYVIPSNDDAIRAIKLLVAKIADAVLDGKAMRKDEEEAEAAAAEIEGATEPARTRQPVSVVETEEEPEEGALLGEATLAKLSAARQPEEPPAAAEESQAKTEEPEAKAEEPGAKADEAPAAGATEEPVAASSEEPATEAAPQPEETGQAPVDEAASDKVQPAAGGQEPEAS
jgi:small subunit ribosomal protein S2